jgi:hypothetical protein
MRKRRVDVVHPPGILERLSDQLRGREQMLVRSGEDSPLLLISYPRGKADAAKEVEAAYAHTLRSLRPEIVAPYRAIFELLPTMVVVFLRPRNLCSCLGHHHPPGAESRLTKRLAGDLGSPIGEIDLAYEGIREWRPQPLSSMALGEMGDRLEALHFQAAILAVLLHELEHLAFPDRKEQEIRTRSNQFYTDAMEDLVAGETGADYGMVAPSPRP